MPSETIMIGDREHDMVAARNNRIGGIGVLWGYGSRDELLRSGAHALAGSPGDLVISLIESGDQGQAPGTRFLPDEI